MAWFERPKDGVRCTSNGVFALASPLGAPAAIPRMLLPASGRKDRATTARGAPERSRRSSTDHNYPVRLCRTTTRAIGLRPPPFGEATGGRLVPGTIRREQGVESAESRGSASMELRSGEGDEVPDEIT